MLSTWILVPSTLITLIFLSFFIKFPVETALYSLSFILTVPVCFISVKVITLWLIRFLYFSVRVVCLASVVTLFFNAIFPHIFLGLNIFKKASDKSAPTIIQITE